MPTTKYHGKNSALIYKKTGGSAVDLSGSSRSIELDEQASEIDVSTRDDAVANSEAVLTGIPKRKLDIEGLDTTPQASRTWHDIALGDVGVACVYPNGTGSGAYYESMNVTALGSNYKSPHDGPATWKVSWKVTSDPADGSVA
jgi:hypothetical protein